MQAGDILAIRGRGWLSRQILKATGNTVSHVGIALSSDFVIEALNRVKTDILSDSIKSAEKAYVLSPLNISEQQRNEITKKAASFSADDYNYGDIALQLFDSVFKTRWFTNHLSIGLQQHPICSFLVAASYSSVGLYFGSVAGDSITPADIYNFALSNPDKYMIKEIK
jgi:hypothetical protein